MQIATVVYILLVALVAFNITQAYGLDWWLAIPPVALVVVVATVFYIKTEFRHLLANALGVVGILSLVAISLSAVIPALTLIDNGDRDIWTSSLIPLFIIAIGLYGAGLWLRAYSANTSDALDWLANFLSGPGLLLSLLTALVLSAGTLLALDWLEQNWSQSEAITRRFLDRGLIPPTTVLFFFWGLLILFGKWLNTLFLRTNLARWSDSSASVISTHIDRIRSLSDDADRLDDRMEFIWRRHEESFTVPRYIGWVVPVLGFIGTVLGISLAADGIRRLIASESGLSGLSSELGAAIAPLGIAFDTTLIALSLSVILMLFLTLVQRSEEHALNSLERHLRDRVRAY